MEMIVHLDADVFNVVDKGNKCIECRLYDEKRKKLSVGDQITFIKRPENLDFIEAIVEDIRIYPDFNELVKDYSMDEMYLPSYTKEEFLELLEKFYTREEQEQYGVIAIKFKKI